MLTVKNFIVYHIMNINNTNFVLLAFGDHFSYMWFVRYKLRVDNIMSLLSEQKDSR